MLPADQGKYTVVLDVNETLLAQPNPGSPEQCIFRPHAQQFLQSVGRKCEVAIWSASPKEALAEPLNALDAGSNIRHRIYRAERWWKSGRGTKALRQLGRPMPRTLMIDDRPASCVANPRNAIIIPPFEGAPCDALLVSLEALLNALVQSGLNVPVFLEYANRMGLLGFSQGYYRLKPPRLRE
jgi:hypothetical protein